MTNCSDIFCNKSLHVVALRHFDFLMTIRFISMAHSLTRISSSCLGEDGGGGGGGVCVWVGGGGEERVAAVIVVNAWWTCDSV